MVRPIEITDTISKVQAAERIQQHAKAIPEAVQQFQKDLSEKLAEDKVKTPQPSTSGDRIILHVEEHEKDKRQNGEQTDSDSFERQEPPSEDTPSPSIAKPGDPQDHIDIRI